MKRIILVGSLLLIVLSAAAAFAGQGGAKTKIAQVTASNPVNVFRSLDRRHAIYTDTRSTQTAQQGQINVTSSLQTVGKTRKTAPKKVGKTGTFCTKTKTKRTCLTYKNGRLTRVCSTKRGVRSCVRIPQSVSSISWQGFPATAMPAVGKIEVPVGLDGKMTCSGTVVSRTLILTAGHCLKYTDSTMYFAPGATYSASGIFAPYGVWATDSTHWWELNGWKNDVDPALDYALVEFPAGGNDNRLIGDVVTPWSITTGIQFNEGAEIYAIGYPTAGIWATDPYLDGEAQYACDSLYNSQYSQIGSGYELWATCTLTKGASGGPWFVKLSDGTWTIGGINNRCYGPNIDDPEKYCEPYSDYMRSSYFDGRFMDFWNYVTTHLSYG